PGVDAFRIADQPVAGGSGEGLRLRRAAGGNAGCGPSGRREGSSLQHDRPVQRWVYGNVHREVHLLIAVRLGSVRGGATCSPSFFAGSAINSTAVDLRTGFYWRGATLLLTRCSVGGPVRHLDIV